MCLVPFHLLFNTLIKFSVQVKACISPFLKGRKENFWGLEIWILPFDWAQGGEPVEPFVICCLVPKTFCAYAVSSSN